MKLLFDQNLSHRLIQLLADLFPSSSHVRFVGLQEADDREIWEYAKQNDFVIVTFDSDYSDWNKVLGAPPKLVWLRFGNASVDTVHSKLRVAANEISQLGVAEAEMDIVEIW